MRNRLRGAFGTLEMETVEGENWAGQPALAVRFTGSLDDVQIRGEAYAIAHKGIGYVFFAWAPDASWNEIHAEAAGLRRRSGSPTIATNGSPSEPILKSIPSKARAIKLKT